MGTLNLQYYFSKVQRTAGLRVSPFFPSTPNDEEQRVIDAINDTLAELNNEFYLAFKQTEYILTTSGSTSSYNLQISPYNQTFWRVYRMARNGVVRLSDDIPLTYIDYSERDWLRPDITQNARTVFYSAFGPNLLIWPPSAGTQLKIRYYSTANGTDTTGNTQLQLLSNATDLPGLQDEFNETLVIGAVFRLRRFLGNDRKLGEFEKAWETQKRMLNERTAQSEDGSMSLKIMPYGANRNVQYSRYFPFFTPFE
jgi:hypothetical protein